MIEPTDQHQRTVLQKLARQAMLERGLWPDFSPAALAELETIAGPAVPADDAICDLRGLLWCSIDNDDSRDLDQLTVIEAMPGAAVKLRVAIADVDALVKKDSALDLSARQNTTSVYTAAEIFPMLPEKLSTDLTSLDPATDRLAVVVEMVIAPDGTLQNSAIYRALVHNQAQLAYNSVAAWLNDEGPIPPQLEAVPGLAENIRLQDDLAQKLKLLRHENGALNLQTIEARPVFDGDALKKLEVDEKNRAKDIIEDFMIAANGVTARYLSAQKFPSIRRVVRTPKRWERIVELAAERNFALPETPSPKALDKFLLKEKAADPLRFPDLSLSVIKLLGAGEYMAEFPGDDGAGHFGLAVRDYNHATAPNRRYPDLITQRLLKAALAGQNCPYRADELITLARHCNEAEDAAKKVERQIEKSAAAMVLASRMGEKFEGIVTGAAEKGTWVRLFEPPVEGKLVSGFEGVDVGRKIKVQLVGTDVERGYIDFRRVK